MELAFLPQKEFMLRALELAGEAAQSGETPVGAVVVKDGRIVGEGRNRRESAKNALAHAELEAIAQACEAVGDWRLTGCILYVTLEPCPMCTGAILNAYIDRVVYGADDDRAGCCGTAANLLSLPFGRRFEVYRGFYEAESKELLKNFFRGLRQKQSGCKRRDLS